MANQVTRKSLKHFFVQAISIVIGGVIGLFLGQRLEQGPHAVGYFGFLGLFGLGIVIHELGHVVGALQVDFRVCSFTVGPITIRRAGGHTTIRWGTLRVAGLVGLAPNGIYDLRRRMLIVTAAGPAASLIGGVCALAIGLRLPESLMSSVLSLGGSTSCALGLLSLIPARKFYSSDGAKIWDLLRAKERSERQCAALALLAELNAGTRPRDWNAELIGRLLELQDGSGLDISSFLLAFSWAKDRHDFDAAQRYLEAVIERQKICPPLVKSAIALEAAFFYSLIRGDSATGRKWFDQCKKRLITEKYFLLMAQAAVLLSEGKTSEALTAASHAMKVLSRAQFAGSAVAAKDWLEAIAHAAQHGRTSIELFAVATAQ